VSVLWLFCQELDRDLIAINMCFFPRNLVFVNKINSTTIQRHWFAAEARSIVRSTSSSALGVFAAKAQVMNIRLLETQCLCAVILLRAFAALQWEQI